MPSIPYSRYKDPQRLWPSVIGGSVALHIAVLLAMPLLLRVAGVRAEVATQPPVPVELIDINTLTPSAASGASFDTPSTSAEAPSAVTPPIAEPLATLPPAAQTPIALEQPIDPSFDFEPVPVPPATVAPTPTPTPTPLVSSPPLGSTPDPQLPILPPDAFEPVPPNPLPVPPETIAGSPIPSPEMTIPGTNDQPGAPMPPDASTTPGDVGSASGQTGNPASEDDSTLPEIAINSEPVPTSLRAQVVEVTLVPLSENPTDIPEQAAQPAPFHEFIADPTNPASCLIPPESVGYFGQPVSLRVQVDTEGRVVATYPREPSPHPAYMELAQCLVRSWPFTPASTEGVTVYSDNVIVTLVIERLN